MGIVETITNIVPLMFQHVDNVATTVAGNMSGHGKSLFIALATVVFLFNTLMNVLDEKTTMEHIAEVLKFTFHAGLLLFMLNSYDSLFGPSGTLVSGFNVLITSVNPDLLDSSGKIAKVVLAFIQPVVDIWNPPSSTIEGGGLLNMLKKLLTGDIANVMAGMTDAIIGSLPLVFMKCVATIACLASALMYAAMILITKLGLAIGIALGPILIPFGILPQTKWLFESWLRYLIGVGFQFLVAGIVAQIVLQIYTAAGISSMITTAAIAAANPDLALATTNGTYFMALLTCVFINLIMCYMIWEVPALTQKVVGGGGLGANIRMPRMPQSGKSATQKPTPQQKMPRGNGGSNPIPGGRSGKPNNVNDNDKK